MIAARRVVHVLVFSIALLSFSLASRPLFAQDSAQPEIENSKYQFAGVVNSNAVFVRSGPSENDYATLKLDKGAEVTVVGIRFEWLKIAPPDGSFCYVAKAYVNRAGNGSIGQVSTTLNVRIGSALNPLKTKVASKLEPGEKVEILGEQDEYFKIKPPADVYLYINKQFVDPLRKITPPANGAASAAPATPLTDAAPQPTGAQDNTAAPTTAPSDNSATTAAPATQPNTATADAAAANPPASQPSAAADAEFDRLESTYAEISQKPLDEQPVEDLLAGYQKLAASDGLPESMRRICDWKVSVLKTRADAKAQFVGAKKVQDDMKSKQLALKAEQGELEQRVKATDVQFYTAVGTLRTSSLQQGRQTLYRLTDPASGRTVVYLRSDDGNLAQFIGQFIGVKGDVATDSQLSLRIVTPTSYQSVNPAKVGQSVAAQIVPPSLLPGGTGTASSTSGGE